MLDLIGFTEGTDKKRGYNETLAYGAYTGGQVDLVSMTLDEVDELQTKMLAHPKNKWNSSAAGRYQIVRRTRRRIQKVLKIPGTALYNEIMQDRMCCFLLGERGIDDYLRGDLPEENMLVHLAQEWASFPTPAGKGYYDNQKRAAVKPERVRAVLATVKSRSVRMPPESMPMSLFSEGMEMTHTNMDRQTTVQATAVIEEKVEMAVRAVVEEPKIDAADSAIMPISTAVSAEIVPLVLHNTNNEPWYQSRVTWGAIITILVPLAGVAGIQLDWLDADQFVSLMTAFATTVGGFITLYGRWVATRPIGS